MKGKQTLIYTRVSTEEQADRGFSLRDQEARLREHCARTSREVVGHYQDDASAKTFDRPAFQRLLRWLRTNRGGADELLVVKWDRFSRDMTGALDMIRRLNGVDVEVQAVEQPIDWEIPEQRMMLAVYLAVPEVENRRRSINTIMGTRRALREGRWCNAPPLGYRYIRDEHNKPLLTPSEKAPLVREAFDLAASTDLAVSEILLRLKKRGLRYSRSKLYELLRRPIYKGYLNLPAWRDEPAELIRGLHDPIVPGELWARVQEARFGVRRPQAGPRARGGPRADFPLRGHLACPHCSSSSKSVTVTASASRGKLGVRYAYYHCHRCGHFRERAETVHAAIPAFLRELQIAPAVADLYRAITVDMAKEAVTSREAERSRGEAELAALEAKLLRADEMYFEGKLEEDSYRRLKIKLRADLDRGRDTFEPALPYEDVSLDAVSAAAGLLSALPAVWTRAEEEGDAEAMSDLLGSIIPEKVTFEGGAVRTPWGAVVSRLFRPQMQNADSVAEPASRVVAGMGFEPMIFGL